MISKWGGQPAFLLYFVICIQSIVHRSNSSHTLGFFNINVASKKMHYTQSIQLVTILKICMIMNDNYRRIRETVLVHGVCVWGVGGLFVDLCLYGPEKCLCGHQDHLLLRRRKL